MSESPFQTIAAAIAVALDELRREATDDEITAFKVKGLLEAAHKLAVAAVLYEEGNI